MDTYRNVIDTAKTKVADPNQISISGVPPRTDSEQFQNNVDVLNACLSTMAVETGVPFINHDQTFKLGDGTPNDGYLQTDGIHLTHKGTNRLAKNLKLKLGSSCKNGNVVRSKTQNPTPVNSSRLPVPEKNSEWKVVNRRPHSHKPSQRSSHYRGQEEKNCWYCGETNHVSKNCRHGKMIICHTCNGQGHKAKHCIY